MPFLRYVRDRRGNENTYLVHTFRRFGKTHPEILYWFRTPPHIQIGRNPLDDGTMKVIQENFPYVKFDWPKILERKPPQSNANVDDDFKPRRRQKLRTEPKRGRRKKTAEKETGSSVEIEESPNDELLAKEGLVSEIKGVDPANSEESSTKAVVQPAPSGDEQETPRSSKATPRRRRRSRGNSRNRRSNSEKRDRASEPGQKAAFQEDAGNSQMDAKLKVNETEVQGNTVKELASPSEISEDMQAGVPSDKTKSSS